MLYYFNKCCKILFWELNDYLDILVEILTTKVNVK